MPKSSIGHPGWMVVTLVAMPLGVIGCAMSNPVLSSGPQPRVEDCAPIQQATPSRYICVGKTYTSVQLTDIRNGKQLDSK